MKAMCESWCGEGCFEACMSRMPRMWVFPLMGALMGGAVFLTAYLLPAEVIRGMCLAFAGLMATMGIIISLALRFRG